MRADYWAGVRWRRVRWATLRRARRTPPMAPHCVRRACGSRRFAAASSQARFAAGGPAAPVNRLTMKSRIYYGAVSNRCDSSPSHVEQTTPLRGGAQLRSTVDEGAASPQIATGNVRRKIGRRGICRVGVSRISIAEGSYHNLPDLPCDILPYHILHRPTVSYPKIPYPTIPYPILSWPILAYPSLS